MINNITRSSARNLLLARYAAKPSAENSFADALCAAQGGNDDLLSAAPEKWLWDWTGESPVRKAVKFLSDMGIDVENASLHIL